MHKTHLHATCADQAGDGSHLCRLVLLGILFVIAVTSVSCGRSTAKLALAERDAKLRQIAADYARDGDLARAQNELAKLKLANPAQLLVITAVSYTHLRAHETRH